MEHNYRGTDPDLAGVLSEFSRKSECAGTVGDPFRSWNQVCMPRITRTYEMTAREVKAIMDAADVLSAMVGTGTDFDPMARTIVKHVDAFLGRNAMRRGHS